MRFDLLAAATVLLLLWAAPAIAAPCGSFLDPITVTGSTVGFGPYSPASGLTPTVMEQVKVTCGLVVDLLPSFTVALDKGLYGTVAQRQMAKGLTDRLNYNIYLTSSESGTVWGDGTGTSQTQSFSSVLVSIGTIKFTGYGILAASQFVNPGFYSDTVTVSVTF
jgi:spore coat protein U-like protein